MQRSLTVAVNFVSLQAAVFCVQCELLSENNTPRCLACGSGAVLSLSRVLGGSLRGQQTAHLIADAELDRLVRSLLYTVPQIAEAEQDEHQFGERIRELPAAATISSRHRMRPRHHGPVAVPHTLINAGETKLFAGHARAARLRMLGCVCKPIADSPPNACAPGKCCCAMTPSRIPGWIGRHAGGWECAPFWSLRYGTSGGRSEFSRYCRRRRTRSTTTMSLLCSFSRG
jgi:hypothetical protein